MCDKYLGKVLDKMDEYHLWEDTFLIVNTDHGFFLGEKDQWAKKSNELLMLEPVAHTPLFIYDPISRRTGRSDALVQTIDLAPTLLQFFGQPICGACSIPVNSKAWNLVNPSPLQKSAVS